MARQWTALRKSRLILGAALVGLGIFMLYENFTIAAGWLSHAFGANSEALGIVPALIWAISQWMPTHAANQHFLHHILTSSWPLLLVILGTVLTSETVLEGTELQSKNWSPLALATARSTSKFRSYYQSSSLPLDMRQNRISE
jgi:hypothetical protein